MSPLSAPHPFPAAYKRPIPSGPLYQQVNAAVESAGIQTICHNGKCPNRGECFSRGALAFMILGTLCTRRCGFCAVAHGNPGGAVDPTEPERVGRAAEALRLRHVVVTSVTRDDLTDGGAGLFAATVAAIRQRLPAATIEVLTPDFGGNPLSLNIVLEAGPDIFNHNLETVERLTPRVRSRASYRRSLDVLRFVKSARRQETLKTKSGFMLGMGESRQEIFQTIKDLRTVGCDYLTVGQYLPPSPSHLEARRYASDDDFRFWETRALRAGFERVAAGPFVRSSYFADRLHAAPLSPEAS